MDLSTISDGTVKAKDSGVAVLCENILVEYVKPSIKTNTLKETVIRKLRGQLHHTKMRAIDGVSLHAAHGECISIIGHNGCGKSTILKVIAGIIDPKKGKVEVHGRLAAMIELGTGFDPELSGSENIYLCCSLMGMSRKEIAQRYPSIVEFSELGDFIHAPVKTYSSGMFARLGFACSTGIDPDVLIIDEILSVGDENFQRKCFIRINEIRDSGKTIIIVTHDMDMVCRFSDRAYVLNNGKEHYVGAPSEAVREYRHLMEERRLSELSAEEREEIKRQETLQIARTAPVVRQYGERVGSGEARILSAKIHHGKGEVALQTAQPWIIEIYFEVKSALTDSPVINFSVLDETGRRLFGGNSKVHPFGEEQTLQRLCSRGEHRVTFRFDRFPLASGTYTLEVGLNNSRLDSTLDYLSRYKDFSVVNTSDVHNIAKDVCDLHALFRATELS